MSSRSCTNTTTFKRHLKTVLYRQAFPDFSWFHSHLNSRRFLITSFSIAQRWSFYVSVSLSYHVSQVGVLSNRLITGTQVIIVLEGSLGIAENKGTFLWNFVPNSELSPRHVDRHKRCQLNTEHPALFTTRWT